ncbi:hypothetical protein BJ165DRAFT_478320 [Panaeolus papilionaceus]|nr:hypothetical protein BJ165DRAFT_478320 [Panaeolus papilionaceus]
MDDTSEQLSLVASSSNHSRGILSTIAEETDAPDTQLNSESGTLAPPAMVRQETLETLPIQRSEHAEELSNILGNAHAHLNKLSGKERLDPSNGELHSIYWEQYSPHAQIELDLELESNIAVQGDCFRGHVLVNVNPKEPLLVGVELGKIRLLGLEWLSKHDERSVFYNFSTPLLLAAPDFRSLLTSEPDEEGFAMISVGSFCIPFTLQIPCSSDHGQPKGRFSQQGVSVRTVALVTLRVKYPVSRKQSIAHFFRECVLWPKVDPQKVLHPQTRPIQVTTSEGDIHLTASLYPPTWVAGQDCRIKVVIKNASQTPIKSLEIGLFNSITVFHPPPCQPGKEEEHTTIQLSKATLKVKHHSTPGHATAKGWWSGVKPGETRTVYHSILIPVGNVLI